MKTIKIVLIIACTIILMISVVSLQWAWKILTEKNQEDLLRQSLAIASSIDPVTIGTLVEGEGIGSDPEYLRIKDQLRFLRDLFPDVDYICLLKQTMDGHASVLMDSEVSPAQEESIQENEIFETTVDLEGLFSTGKSVIEGPFENEQGTWIRAFIPLVDSFSGDVLAILMLNKDASNWASSIRLDFYLPLSATIIFNFSIWGLIALLDYWQKKRNEPQMEVLARYAMVVLTGVIGICTTIISVWFVGYFERDSREEIFQQLSLEKAHNLAFQLKAINQFSLNGLEQFFLGSDHVARYEFEQYAAALVSNELVSAWAWVPAVAEDERTIFENDLRKNLSSYGGIWEYDTEGIERKAGNRNFYYPVQFIAPETPENLELIGFDLASSIVGSSIFESSLQTGLAVGSTPTHSIYRDGKEYLLVARPVANYGIHSEAGFVVALIQIEKLSEAAQINDNLSGSTVFLDFIQYTREGESYLLVSNSPDEILQEHLQPNLQYYSQTEFIMIQPIFAYGNTFAAITHPSPIFSSLHPAMSEIILIISGGLFTIVLMIFVNYLSGRNVILSRLVRQRTKDLSESEERLRLASKSVKLGVYEINTRMSEVIVNDVYAEMLGYLPEEFSETFDGFLNRIHPDDRRKTQKIIKGFMEDSVSDYKVEFRLKTAKGDWIWVFSTSMVIEWDEMGQPLRILGSHLNITAMKEANLRITHLLEQSNRSLRRLEALREIDKSIISAYDLDQTFNAILTQVKDQLQIDAAAIFLYDEKAQVFHFTKGIGLSEEKFYGWTLDRKNSLAGRVSGYGRPMHIQAFEELVDPAFLPYIEEEGFKDCFVFALGNQGKIKGVMELWHRSLKVPTSEWMNYAGILAGQAAIAIEHIQLISGLREANEDLKRAYDATIEGWSHAMDLKDKETESHTQRVTRMTVELARRVGIEGEALDHIRRGALLHDIGKMGIPDSILLKPGQLTDEEWAMMKNHPVYAYEMLKKIDYLRPALDIPYLHHEKWDGTGYPRGLKGDKIPLPARLFAFADVFDALTTDRPYRPAWSVEKALEYIEQNSGIHFDPNITPIFMAMINEEYME